MPELMVRDSPRAMAAARIGIGLATIFFALEMFLVLRRIAEGALAVPVIGAMPDVAQPAVGIYASALALAGLALTLGIRSRETSLFVLALLLGLLAWDQQGYSHHGWLLISLLPWVALGGADRRWALPRNRHVSPRSLGQWPALLLMTQLSVCYAFAAISKMNGNFLSGDQFEAWLRWDLPHALNLGMAVGTIVTELFLAAGLWFTVTRGAAVALGIALHVSIIVMMAEGTLPFIAFALLCLPLYPLYATLGPATPRTVIWDSHCSFCRRWVALFRFLDWMRVHRFIGSDDPAAFEDARVTPAMADEAIQLLTPTHRAEGFDAVRRILAVCPLTFWTAPVLWLPPVRDLGDRAYRRVAARRTCKVG